MYWQKNTNLTKKYRNIKQKSFFLIYKWCSEDKKLIKVEDEN